MLRSSVPLAEVPTAPVCTRDNPSNAVRATERTLRTLPVNSEKLRRTCARQVLKPGLEVCADSQLALLEAPGWVHREELGEVRGA